MEIAMDKIISDIAQRLKGLRESCGYTVEELCDDTDTMKKWEIISR